MVVDDMDAKGREGDGGGKAGTGSMMETTVFFLAPTPTPSPGLPTLVVVGISKECDSTDNVPTSGVTGAAVVVVGLKLGVDLGKCVALDVVVVVVGAHASCAIRIPSKIPFKLCRSFNSFSIRSEEVRSNSSCTLWRWALWRATTGMGPSPRHIIPDTASHTITEVDVTFTTRECPVVV